MQGSVLRASAEAEVTLHPTNLGKDHLLLPTVEAASTSYASARYDGPQKCRPEEWGPKPVKSQESIPIELNYHFQKYMPLQEIT